MQHAPCGLHYPGLMYRRLLYTAVLVVLSALTQSALLVAPTHISTAVAAPQEELISTAPAALESTVTSPASRVFSVPFYSQFTDITPPEWKKISCGIASLAMLIDFYGDAVVADELLQEGIQSGAYITDAGWSHAGLIALAQQHGLEGRTQGLSHLSMTDAFAALKTALAEGPVMVSVHYTFDPQNPIPHLVVITGVADGLVYYNDPAEDAGAGTVSITQFTSAWKKRYIEIRPAS